MIEFVTLERSNFSGEVSRQDFLEIVLVGYEALSAFEAGLFVEVSDFGLLFRLELVGRLIRVHVSGYAAKVDVEIANLGFLEVFEDGSQILLFWQRRLRKIVVQFWIGCLFDV